MPMPQAMSWGIGMAVVDEVKNAGSYQVHWDARDQGGFSAAAGVYLAHLLYPGGVQTRRLLVLR